MGVELAGENLPEAEHLLTEAAAVASAGRATGDQLFEAQLLYRRGQLRLKQGRPNEADHDVARAAALLAELGGEEHALRKLMLAEWEHLATEGQSPG